MRTTIAVATAAVAVALTPSGAQAGAAPDPVFTYIDVSADPVWQLSVANADGSQITTPTTVPFGLTPSGYQSYGYDVSEDGSTVLVQMRRGAPTAYVRDSTFGLVLVHREGDTITSWVLSSGWVSNPVLSADGMSAWWLDENAAGKVTLWKHTQTDWTSQGSTGAVDSVNFLNTDPAQEPIWLDVSPDGTKAAVLSGEFTSTGVTRTQVRAATIGDASGGRIAQSYGTSATQAVSASFVWLSDSQLLYTVEGPSGLNSLAATLPPSGVGPTPTVVLALKGFYDLHRYGASWYMWKEVGAAGAEQSAMGSSADPLSPPADDALAPRSNGRGTIRYIPTATAPPSLVAAVDPMPTMAQLKVYAAHGLAAYGTKVGYYSWATYQRTATYAGIVFRGILQTSYDGVTFRNAISTSGARPVRVGGATYLGYTPVLARNTWFRWYYPGDLFTSPSYSEVSRVYVTPRVAVSLARSGTSTTVKGAATRHRGTAQLQRLVGGRWTTVATTTLTYAGAYSFGARRLAAGSYYRVLTLADRYWAVGLKVFKL